MDTSWLFEPTTGVHQFGGGSDIDVFAKPKRKKGTPMKKHSTAKTFRKPLPKKKITKKKLRR
jgi:hypothetical protein